MSVRCFLWHLPASVRVSELCFEPFALPCDIPRYPGRIVLTIDGAAPSKFPEVVDVMKGCGWLYLRSNGTSLAVANPIGQRWLSKVAKVGVATLEVLSRSLLLLLLLLMALALLLLELLLAQRWHESNQLVAEHGLPSLAVFQLNLNAAFIFAPSSSPFRSGHTLLRRL